MDLGGKIIVCPLTNPVPMAIFPGNDGVKVDVEQTHG
jgi:hypothetical protein